MIQVTSQAKLPTVAAREATSYHLFLRSVRRAGGLNHNFLSPSFFFSPPSVALFISHQYLSRLASREIAESHT